MMVPNNPYDDKDLLDFLGQQESQDIDWGSEHADDLADRVKNGRILTGATLPWANTHEFMRFGEGKVTIWAGMNGHKKSMMLGQIVMWMAQTERVGISSFEMPILDTMERLVYQAAGCVPSSEYARKWALWCEERICFYDKLDTVGSERVIGSMFYMAKELGCKHIMIDSLTKCGLPSGDKDAEKKFIDMLAATAKALKIHIHLVAHVRKPPQGGESYIPNKFDVRGAGELTDLVDNLMIVWMDKKKEEIKKKRDANKSLSAEETDYLLRPDQRLICLKQRGGAWEGTIGLWFDPQSLQFLHGENVRPLPFAV